MTDNIKDIKELELDCSDVKLVSTSGLTHTYCYTKKAHRIFALNGAILFDEKCNCK